MNKQDTSTAIGPTIGHVHLRVADLRRSINFYTDVIGLEFQALLGESAAFLSSNGYHHHLGLNTWESLGATQPPKGHTGLFHTAFLYPDRTALAVAVRRVIAAGVPLTGKADHGVSEALYLDDPDGNGVELYWDRQPEDWPRDSDGKLLLKNDPLDLEALIAEIS